VAAAAAAATAAYAPRPLPLAGTPLTWYAPRAPGLTVRGRRVRVCACARVCACVRLWRYWMRTPVHGARRSCCSGMRTGTQAHSSASIIGFIEFHTFIPSPLPSYSGIALSRRSPGTCPNAAGSPQVEVTLAIAGACKSVRVRARFLCRVADLVHEVNRPGPLVKCGAWQATSNCEDQGGGRMGCRECRRCRWCGSGVELSWKVG
jgi:hypothetical protein